MFGGRRGMQIVGTSLGVLLLLLLLLLGSVTALIDKPNARCVRLGSRSRSSRTVEQE